MPKLWNETIEGHRRAVYDATLDATAALVAAHGLLSVTMSQIASETGIGRATLYKYFPDVETILTAWHKRQIAHHLDHLAHVRDQTAAPAERLEAVLRAYADVSHGHADDDLAAFLHRGQHISEAEQHLHDFIQQLIADAGDVRTDTSPNELASYCLHAISAASSARSKAAAQRLVTLVLDGLRPTTTRRAHPDSAFPHGERG
jgi:AcrR family transcriptional regulator